MLRLVSDRLYRIKQRQRLVDTLHVGNIELVMALQYGRILYVEGWTDLEILRAWGAVLAHGVSRFMEEPFCKLMAEDSWTAKRHFAALRLSVPELQGVELCDSNDKQGSIAESSSPEGMTVMVWRQYEIENYLIHPDAILRWLHSIGGETAVRRAERYMKDRFPPAIYDDPHGADYFQRKGKKVLSEVCEAARIRVDESEYYRIATDMRRNEIHPEVIEKLDAIAEILCTAGQLPALDQ